MKHTLSGSKAKPKMKKKVKVLDPRNELFDITCFYMGQGDCSLIRCPDGKIVMVDCGSKADFTDDALQIAAEQVRSTNWAGSTMRIDALILTHKDRDHYSQVGWVLGGSTINGKTYNRLKIDEIYFSWASSDISPLGRYTCNGLNQVVYSGTPFKTKDLYEVTINSPGNNFYKKWSKANAFANVVPNPGNGAATVPIAGRKFTILNGTTAGGKQWSVSLIAGNVLKVASTISDMGDGEDYKDGATEDNARSLITLLEIDGKKALFCGDATFSTERFLVLTQLAMITDVQFLFAPHHGSEWASSPPFVDATNPDRVAVSSEYMEHSHLHPRKVAVTRWLAKTEAATAHNIDYWENSPTKADTTLTKWQTQGLSLDNSTRFFWLMNLPSVNIYYGVKRRIGVLYRAEVSKYLEETAMLELDDPTTPKFLKYQVG